jgi:hypothetical protein
LREAALYQVRGNEIQLKGKRGMRLFRFGAEPKEFEPGTDVRFLLQG